MSDDSSRSGTPGLDRRALLIDLFAPPPRAALEAAVRDLLPLCSNVELDGLLRALVRRRGTVTLH